MMNCRRVVNLMSAYVDGELTGVEMLEIRRHLSECPECAGERESILFTKQALARLRNVAPRKEFAASLLGRLDEAGVPGYCRLINSASTYIHQRLSPVAAALAAAGVALVILSAGGMDSVRPQAPEVVAGIPVQAQFFDTIHVSEVPGSPISIASSRPLPVASETPDLSAAHIELASIKAW